jgi:hypothetical protein
MAPSDGMHSRAGTPSFVQPSGMQRRAAAVSTEPTAAEEAATGWKGAEIVTKKLRRPPSTPGTTQALEWVALSGGPPDAGKEQSHEELRVIDAKRKRLLELARNTSATQSLFQLWQLPRTVLPRLIRKPIIWLVLLTYAVGVILGRLALLSDEMLAEAAQRDGESGSAAVTFMVVFYVGYCYSRSNQQFDDVQLIMHSINDACLIARVTFEDKLEVHRLWRYLNMLHAAAFCGLTDELTENNFFMPMCEKFCLLSQGAVRKEELESIARIQIDDSGSRACAMFEVWAFEVLKGEALRSGKSLTPPIHARLMNEINNVSVSIKRLFAYRYQVLPYIYTHLVSLSCAIYLFRSTFLAGLEVTPDSSSTFGLILPATEVIGQIVATFGLIEVGETILDPFGSDPEDYALLHFVEVTAVSSHEAIHIGIATADRTQVAPRRHCARACVVVTPHVPNARLHSLTRGSTRIRPALPEPCGLRVQEREQYYEPMELVAANKLVRGMIRRYRWRKVMEQAKTQAEFERRMRGAPVDLLETRPKVPKGGGPRQARYDNSAKLPREAGKTYVKVQRRHRSTKKQDAELAECVSAASASSPTEHPGRVRGTSPATLPTSANGSLHLGA